MRVNMSSQSETFMRSRMMQYLIVATAAVAMSGLVAYLLNKLGY